MIALMMLTHILTPPVAVMMWLSIVGKLFDKN
jgi:hypothetical protein